MATTKKNDEVARGSADVALALSTGGPRDALTDPLPHDYIPDVDTKGLHVGEVRQPAEPVLKRGGDVTFESLGETGESKFAPVTYAEQVKANSAWEAEQGDLYAGREHVAPLTDPAEIAAAKERLMAASAPARRSSRSSSDSGSNAASKLDADAAAVAGAQAAEDKSDK